MGNRPVGLLCVLCFARVAQLECTGAQGGPGRPAAGAGRGALALVLDAPGGDPARARWDSTFFLHIT